MVGFILEPNISLALEYCAGGTLLQSLEKHENEKSFDWKILVKIGLDLSRALCYLHSQKPAIIHNDLKPDNVMVIQLDTRAPITVKLIDFGFSIATVDGKRKDIKSFGSMFGAITKFYCSDDHPSARVAALPTLSHLLPSIYLPDVFQNIIKKCQTNYTADKLEFKFSKLWKRISNTEIALGLIPHKQIQQTFNSVFHNANKSVILEMIKKTNPNEIDEQEISLLKDHVFQWMDQKDIESLKQFFEVININQTFGELRETAIMYASQSNNKYILKRLFYKNLHNIHCNQVDYNGNSALHYAIQYGSYLSLRFLIDRTPVNIHLSSASIPFCDAFGNVMIHPNRNSSVLSSKNSLDLLSNSSRDVFKDVEILHNINVLECGMLSIFSNQRLLSDFNQTDHQKNEKKKLQSTIDNINRCMTYLLSKGAFLTHSTTKMVIPFDRLDLLRAALFSFFERFVLLFYFYNSIH